VTNIEGFSM